MNNYLYLLIFAAVLFMKVSSLLRLSQKSSKKYSSTRILSEIQHSYDNFKFEVLKSNGPAKERLGLLTTPHGDVRTPAFIFCATKATIKGITPEMMRNEVFYDSLQMIIV